eukprot:CAMPEP_0203748984 /NCGR_PEP_ID=MMETSP0098-20131031/3703_1 /ASSEMBLY_ACC=CAM_ASM_000208 /TAXON_ID=96639 /ORGANISM=" , Strain NY0313808BC1" /LENGTH=610 /DNA_ID=CAMNT_0050637911 /DNA_START=36 /DNA_END=1868 /DNA_ORIENTATION=+
MKFVAVVLGTAAATVPLAQASVLRDTFDFVSNIGSHDAVKTQMASDGEIPTPNKLNIVHREGVKIADYSQDGLPKVRLEGRVMDLINGIHWDDILQDTPDEMRPSAAVVFYDSSDEVCMAKYAKMRWDARAETQLPARERLFAARYDMHAAPRRAWYKFTPEMDLAKRFQVTDCPQLVYVSRKCNGETEWCSRGFDPKDENIELMGCEDFVDQCTHRDYEKFTGNYKEIVGWLKAKIKDDGAPMLSPFLHTYSEQGHWIKSRDTTSTDNHMRNIFLSQAFPGFSERGFKAVPIPDEFYKWLLSFYERHQKDRRTEFWDASSTQMSFHEVKTGFVDMDMERYEKERMANKHLKPMLEEWSDQKPLELTSFYGQREYPEGITLKNHLDRIDTHVLSVTLSLKKINTTKDSKPWPLEVIDWTGQHVRYHHPAGTMVLYESSKLPHGRPYRNRGGVHLGCFCHFKPKQMHGSDAQRWEEIVKKARNNKMLHSEYKPYKSTRSEEPPNPVYSPIPYGEDTRWQGDGSEEEAGLEPGQLAVNFINKADRALDVYWQSPEGHSVHQGRLSSGASFSINTYRNHRFFFAEVGSKKPLPAGTLSIEKGRTDYAYNSKQD